MRIGVMGGTFDPIHRGHVQVADQVARALDLDQVVFVPAGSPWMKQAPGASAADRLAMVQLAIDGDDRFIASRVDVDRPGPTYAVDTLSDLQREFATVHPAIDANWLFIVGADALADFMEWHDPGRILELADLVGVTRPGHALTAPPIPAERLTLLEVASLDISSSTIRHLVAIGAPIEELVAPSVAQYIAEHELYQQVEGQDRDGSR